LCSDLEDAVALVVEYMDGGSLQDLVDAGGCASEAVLANISTQVTLDKLLPCMHELIDMSTF
jgi:serine/threonine protein kinase